ncbi:exodeoxyribonuclease V subunit beta [uncultured Corynebacterium sp.]|uniref:UvrD-helicase domain-containing protein n=1 Tax=uncultured Corynebacterium sp. TaxID=159447 RepID=UPI002599EC91|nr:UvrD-helicase domain-containing protein [uncultured Corynebacterium sp.]
MSTGNYSHYTLVQASAGSGKTFRITEDLAQAIDEGKDPSRIIATTFTKDAAAELAGRISVKLVEKGKVVAAQEIDSALVGTVNSITDALVRRFALHNEISPELAVLSENAEKLAFDTACDEVLAAYWEAHRDLIKRVGYAGRRTVHGGLTEGQGVWTDSVKKLSQALRANAVDVNDRNDLEEHISKSQQAFADNFDLGNETGDIEEIVGRAKEAYDSLMEVINDDSTEEKWLGDEKLRKTSVTSLKKNHAKRTKIYQRLSANPAAVSWGEALKLTAGELVGGPKVTGPITTTFADEFPTGMGEITKLQTFRDDTFDIIRIAFEAARDCVNAYTEAKREAGLIDFTDQEARALKLLQDPHGEASEWIRESFDVMVVDEFQDTSPLQLAIFLKTGALVGDVRWVGDPKQSIYGFRGADPILMQTAAHAIEEGGGQQDSLSMSWRSSGIPLKLSNEYFSRAFADQTNVTLKINEARRERRRNIDHEGRISVWRNANAEAKVGLQLTVPIVKGIQELHAENPKQSIAVLVRSNADAEKVLAELRQAGIPATGKDVSVDEEVEAMLLVAGLRYCSDGSDRASLFELITLMPEHAAHATWFKELASAPDRKTRTELKNSWADDPSLAAVNEIARHIGQLTPSRAITELIDALDLRARIASSPSPAGRYDTLLGFLEQATIYESDREGIGKAATVSDFLRNFDAEQRLTNGKGVVARSSQEAGSVFVTTMHGAKGLGWHTVILGLKKSNDKLPPDVWTEPTDSGAFTLEAPLEGRHVMFWPYTLTAQKASKEHFLKTPLMKKREERTAEENKRLAYVALTRSKEHTVFVATEKRLDSHDPLDKNNVVLSTNDAEGTIAISSATTEPVTLPADFRTYSEDDESGAPVSNEQQRLLPEWRGESTRTAERKAARFAASLVTSAGWEDRADTAVVATLGARLVEHGEMDWNKVGDAIHTYLGTSYTALDEAAQLAHAEAILGRWGVSAIEAKDLVEAGRRWDAWLTENYPDAPRLTEVPMRYLADGQVAEGWIDMLLDTGDDTVVLIDHKSNPGNQKPAEFVKKHYLGQMATYRAALEAAGKRCDRILIHMPLAGAIVEVAFRDEPSA